jgi:type IX secretion system PorP/SprF family membrane protein
MKNLKLYIVTILILIICIIKPNSICSQDIHFSLFDWQANYNNPALTGFLPETQVGLQYRDQGFRVSEYSYKSYSIFADSYMNREVRDSDHLGVGGSLIVDQAGAGNINTMEALVNLAYHLSLKKSTSTYLSISPQIGFIQRELSSIDNLTFEEELLGGSFSEQFYNSNSQYLDAGFGIALRHKFNKEVDFTLVYSLHHLNDSKNDFSELNVDKIPKRSHAHTSLIYPINERLLAESQIHFHKSDIYRELIFKQSLSLNLSSDKIDRIDFGLGYRSRDALIINFGLSFDRIDLGLAYEVNSSDLSQASSPSAAFEIALKYHLPFSARKDSIYIAFVEPKHFHLAKLPGRLIPDPVFVRSFEKLNLDKLKNDISPNEAKFNIIRLEHIYFDFDKSVVKQKYEPRLAEIKKMLSLYPEGKWTIIGHTDSRGSKTYNQKLSERRLNNVVKWLENNNIFIENLTPIYKGELELVNDCIDGVDCPRSEHRLNRRVTISIRVQK